MLMQEIVPEQTLANPVSAEDLAKFLIWEEDKENTAANGPRCKVCHQYKYTQQVQLNTLSAKQCK